MRIKEIPEDFRVTEIARRDWSREGPYYVYTLSKRDITTREAIRQLAKENRCSEQEIRCAGNKDRRAVTHQFITSSKPLISNDTRCSLLHVGYTDAHLFLGDLLANDFCIRVKDVFSHNTCAIPNYFGEQRFSSQNVLIGIHILKRRFVQAALLLSYQYPSVRYWLEKNPSDGVGALRKVPFQILLLFVHAVQSYLWNEVVSQYIHDTYTEYLSCTYSQGTWHFPKQQNNKELFVPLIGAVSTLGEWKKYYEAILENTGVSQQDFFIRAIPQLTQEGSERKLWSTVQNINIQQDSDSARVEMRLEPGSYATVVLSGLFEAK